MSEQVRKLEPQSLWNNFADLNAVPRPSKKEERVIAFMQDFGKKLGLPVVTDEVGNVIIRKPATKGMENRKKLVIQSHLDMVHQKNNATQFDFDKEGIKMIVDGDWVKADGTTLGADNGIGVASIMALLESTDIPHPAFDALFTIDEETGMTGAIGLKGGLLEGEILLNLDTEDDDELTIGCAGGVDLTATGAYPEMEIPEEVKCVEITINGLSGGHSGMDIIKGLGNANKLMNRLLLNLSNELGVYVNEIQGGGLRNAIPRESVSKIAVPVSEWAAFETAIKEYEETIKDEHNFTDPNVVVTLKNMDKFDAVMEEDFQALLLRAIYAAPNGIYRMSPAMLNMVQTSNNIAQVKVVNGEYSILCLTRSSVESEKWDLAEALTAAFELMGAQVEVGGSYPGWTPLPHSDIVNLMADLYREKFDAEPRVQACHAGLECGILGTNYPKMEMISFGPNIRGAHSPDEKVQISSVQKYWDYFLEALKRIPEVK
ncbi:aminoacyl-histidine dipeptidase [bacterium]|nr:aminoacyl-histidine dipeptidase [bacterium]